VICYTVTFSDILDNLGLITLQYVVVVLIRQYWWLCQGRCWNASTSFLY